MRGAWGWGDSGDGEGVLSCDVSAWFLIFNLSNVLKNPPQKWLPVSVGDFFIFELILI